LRLGQLQPSRSHRPHFWCAMACYFRGQVLDRSGAYFCPLCDLAFYCPLTGNRFIVLFTFNNSLVRTQPWEADPEYLQCRERRCTRRPDTSGVFCTAGMQRRCPRISRTRGILLWLVSSLAERLDATTFFDLFVAICLSQTGSLFSADWWHNIAFAVGEVKDQSAT